VRLRGRWWQDRGKRCVRYQPDGTSAWLGSEDSSVSELEQISRESSGAADGEFGADDEPLADVHEAGGARVAAPGGEWRFVTPPKLGLRTVLDADGALATAPGTAACSASLRVCLCACHLTPCISALALAWRTHRLSRRRRQAVGSTWRVRALAAVPRDARGAEHARAPPPQRWLRARRVLCALTARCPATARARRAALTRGL
jgi:hypothetical protein